MPTVPPDAPTPRPLAFAFPLPDGRWALRPGTALVLDGLLRGIEIPGLGTRTGPREDGGLTAVFFVVYGMKGRRGARTGTVTRWEVEDGRVTRTEEAAIGVELVEPNATE
jgi:hypothetical protein